MLQSMYIGQMYIPFKLASEYIVPLFLNIQTILWTKIQLRQEAFKKFGVMKSIGEGERRKANDITSPISASEVSI